ncbi:hypothetical protein [Lactobacillus acetotolerans]|uniref:hypothetical protein n=1 Tax=Lactobacillus acetotolerans TaxID=1600 RepID=UPI002FDAFDBD
MTKYIKTGTTEFEQFNETRDQCFKFGIIDKALLTSVESVAYGPDRYVLSTFGKGEDMVIYPTDWIATGVNGEHWAVKDEIFKRTYKKLPKLTRPVSRYLEFCKAHWNLNDTFLNAEYLVPNNNGALEVFDYLSEHPDDFARAWLDGYEVVEVEIK